MALGLLEQAICFVAIRKQLESENEQAAAMQKAMERNAAQAPRAPMRRRR